MPWRKSTWAPMSRTRSRLTFHSLAVIRMNLSFSQKSDVARNFRATSYQVKRLGWDDPLSILERFPDFSCWIFLLGVLCCSPFWTKDFGVHKPHARLHFLSLCPKFIQTRWIHDSPMIQLILANQAKIADTITELPRVRILANLALICPLL